MPLNTIPQSEWPKLESLVVLAAKIAGRINNIPDDVSDLTAQTNELYAGIRSLLTAKQLKKVMQIAAANLQHSLTVSDIERQMMTLAFITQAAYNYVQPGMLEQSMVCLLTIVLFSPTWQPDGHTLPIQQFQLTPVTTRDKMLLFFLSTVGSELRQPLKVLHPMLKTCLLQVRDFFENQVLQAPLSADAQAQLTQTLAQIREPYTQGVPANIHWHNMACAALAFTLWAYDSQMLSPLPDQVLLSLVEDRLELNEAYQLQRASN